VKKQICTHVFNNDSAEAMADKYDGTVGFPTSKIVQTAHHIFATPLENLLVDQPC
jgi:hypothetical protein